MGKIISVVNRKGGVGKTTLSIAIADAFVTEIKANVSIIDLDPQASATRALLSEKQFQERTENQTNLVALVRDKLRNLSPDFGDFRQGMVHHYKHSKTVDLGIYANSDEFWNLEAEEIENNSSVKLTEVLLSTIQSIANRKDNDYVIIDCPPGQSVSSLAALMASNLILCPVTTDKMALWGKDLLFKYIDRYTLGAPVKFIASKVKTSTKAGEAAFLELQSSEHMLEVEGGKKSKHGAAAVARLSETTNVHKRLESKPVNELKNIYGANAASELRLIVNAIRREVENG